jgi:hypothetical protein
MERRNKSLIFVSYFCSIKGMVMAEWANDKLLVLSKEKRTTFVLTGLNSNTLNSEFVKFIHVPSLSWRDFKWEIGELKRNSRKLSISSKFFYPISFTVGRAFDIASKRWLTQNSAARWSWAFTSLPVAIYLKIRFNCKEIFCTGGATGGHLLGLFMSFFPTMKLYLEFQDPLLGSEMQRSSVNTKAIIKLEHLFIKRSRKTVYVTKKAANGAKDRNPKWSSKIVSIYPGSWKFSSNISSDNRHLETNSINLIHLGTLYGNRNLDNFFCALDELKVERYEPASRIRVINLGAIYLDNLYDYLKRKEFQNLEPMERELALKYCNDMHGLIIIQHTDQRSQETIPYKVYDYLNLNIPILGIINNDELKDILLENGSIAADNNSIGSIKSSLKLLVRSIDSNTIVRFNSKSFDISEQFNLIFE